MKILISLFTFFSISVLAAEPIIIDIGGVRHSCSPIGGGSAVECYQKAYSGPFSKDESMALCSGAFNEAPAVCAIEAYRGRYSKSESILLCTKATSNTGPIDCANLAYSGPFSKSESLDLCAHNGSERTAVCAIDAYHGPFSKEEAIRMCKNPRFFEEKMSLKKYSKEELTKLIEEANLKAFERLEYK